MTGELFNAFEKACINGDLDKVKELAPANLNYQVDYNKSMHGETPLMLAVNNKQLEVVRFLLEQGADPNLQNNVGPLDYHKWHEGIINHEPLYSAVYKSTREIVELLIEHGAQVNVLIGSRTPLCMAIQLGSIDIIQLLLTHGADPNLYGHPNVFSDIPLFEAVIQKRTVILKDLIKYGVNINARDSLFNETALFWVHEDRTEIAEELINNGIDIHVKNKKGKTALFKATQLKKLKIAELLKQYGATE